MNLSDLVTFFIKLDYQFFSNVKENISVPGNSVLGALGRIHRKLLTHSSESKEHPLSEEDAFLFLL